MKKIKFSFLLAALPSLFIINTPAQTAGTTAGPVTPNLLTNSVFAALPGVASSNLVAGGEAIYNAVKDFSFKQGFDVGLVGLNHDRYWGGGLILQDVNTNTAVHAFAGVFAMQTPTGVNGQREWSFYEGTGGISIQQTETIPILGWPLTINVWTGPGLKLNGGGGILLSQSGISGDLNFHLFKKLYLCAGGGLVYCTDAAIDTSKMGHANFTWRF